MYISHNLWSPSGCKNLLLIYFISHSVTASGKNQASLLSSSSNLSYDYSPHRCKPPPRTVHPKNTPIFVTAVDTHIIYTCVYIYIYCCRTVARGHSLYYNINTHLPDDTAILIFTTFVLKTCVYRGGLENQKVYIWTF